MSTAGRPTLGRWSLNNAPQDPSSFQHWKHRRLHQAATPPPAPAAGPSQGPAASTNATAATAAKPAAATATNPSTVTPAAGGVPLCPTWAANTATTKQTLPPMPDLNTTKDIDVITDLNAVPDGGLTTAGRQDATSAAVVAAVEKATNNATKIEGTIMAVAPPGLFEPLSEEEILAGGWVGWCTFHGIKLGFGAKLGCRGHPCGEALHAPHLGVQHSLHVCSTTRHELRGQAWR